MLLRGLPPQTELWLLLSQGSHFILLYFNLSLCKLVFTQPLRRLDEKDSQQDTRGLSASWLWPKSSVSSKQSWSASLLDPTFYRTTDAHAGPLVCMFLVHGFSFQPRPAQGEIQDDPRGACSWRKLSRAPKEDQASQDETKTAITSPFHTKKTAELCLYFTCISLAAEARKIFFLNPLWGDVLTHP